MPRLRKEPANLPVPIVAAAFRYEGRGKIEPIYRPDQTWQRECYRHYSICGEARFAAVFYANAISRADFFAVDQAGLKIEQGEPADVASVIDEQIRKAIGLHLTIAGDCYLIGRVVDGNDVWQVLSVLNVTATGGIWYVDYGDGQKVPLEQDDPIIRIWVPHPDKPMEGDSPFRTMLPILREIEWLTRHIFAQISSRLAGAGILFLPQGITFPPPPGQEGKEYANDAEQFMASLGAAMMKPIEDPADVSSVVPNVAMVPGDQIDQVKLLHFWSDLDAHSKDLRQEAIQRFATGMDLPREQILGMSSNPGTGGGNSNGVSHWGAWQIEEATIKMHIEPMLDVIVAALTVGYFRPALPEGSTDKMAYTTESLRLRPDRSKEAFELWDRGVLKTEVLLRENGFDPRTDFPEATEFKTWLLVKIASGSATPEQVQGALEALGVPLVIPTLSGPAPQQLPAPSLEDHPTRPRTPGENSALLAAAEGLVFRALERAGNRMRQSGIKPVGVPSYETHTVMPANGNAPKLLTDAWSCAPQVLDGLADSEEVIPMLDSYCQALLSSGRPHTRAALAQWMAS